MKIGIDIDEVVVNFVPHLLDFYFEKSGKRFSVDDVYCYKIEECLGISLGELIEMCDEANNSGFVEAQSFIEGAVDSIKKLSLDNEIVFITSRPLDIEEKTRAILDKNFNDVDFDVIFARGYNNNGASKSVVCRDLGVDVLIEDRKKYAIDCAKNGVRTLLFNRPWNQCCEYEGVVRVGSWKEILGKIEEFS